jgi:hypothetical protein
MLVGLSTRAEHFSKTPGGALAILAVMSGTAPPRSLVGFFTRPHRNPSVRDLAKINTVWVRIVAISRIGALGPAVGNDILCALT